MELGLLNDEPFVPFSAQNQNLFRDGFDTTIEIPSAPRRGQSAPNLASLPNFHSTAWGHQEPIPNFVKSNDDPSHSHDTDIATSWRTVFNTLVHRDEKMIKSYQEEIDALLILAGLFSAIVTAFVIETYQNLQEDNTESIKVILLTMSQQLANSSEAYADNSALGVTATQSDVRVNVLWFISLMLSLACALFGIFTKQWMRSYMSWVDATPPRTAVAIRQFRYESMRYWKFHQVLKTLPLLLQMALMLFGVGLVDFCRHLNPVLGSIIGAVAAIFFLLVVLAIFCPLVSSTFPYRSLWSATLARLRYKITAWAHRQFFLRLKMMSSRDFAAWQAVRSKVHGVFTWNRLDICSINMLQLGRLKHVGENVTMETRSLCSLLKINQDAPTVRSVLTCALWQDTHVLKPSSQQLIDVCHVACLLFGIKVPDHHLKLEYNRDKNDLGKFVHWRTMDPSVRHQLLRTLTQVLDSNWIQSSNPALSQYQYASCVFEIVQYLWANNMRSCHVPLTTQLEHLTFLGRMYRRVVIIGDQKSARYCFAQSVKDAYLNWWLSEPHHLGFHPPEHLQLKPQHFLEHLSANQSSTLTEVAIAEMRRILHVYPDAWRDNPGLRKMINYTAIQQVRQPRIDIICEFFRVLQTLAMTSAAGACGSDRYRAWDQIKSEFWQAIFVLGSRSRMLIPSTLARELCAIVSVRITVGPLMIEDRMMDDTVKQMVGMAEDDVWDMLLAKCHELGSQQRHWTCPGFETLSV